MRTLIVAPEQLSQALMTQPLLARLRRLDPQGTLHVLAPRALVPLFECMADLDTILVHDPEPACPGLGPRLSLAYQMLRLRLDRAWVLSRAQRLPWLSRLGGLSIQYVDPVQALARLQSICGTTLPLQRRAGDPRPHAPLTSLRRHPIREAQARHAIGINTEGPLLACMLNPSEPAASHWAKRDWATLLIRAQRAWPALQSLLLAEAQGRPDAIEINTLSGSLATLVRPTLGLDMQLALLAQAEAVVATPGPWAETAAAFGRPVVLVQNSPEAVWAKLARTLAHATARNLR